LRPLSDIDLLVDSQLAAPAQSVLKKLGFPSRPSPGDDAGLGARHPLPPAIKVCDGHPVMVEIHDNAIGRDSPGSLTTAELIASPQEFFVEGRRARALGHADMLYQLSRHTAERAPLMRLIWIADVVGYATRYHGVIPWTEVRRRYPFVLNALSLLDSVTPLPAELRAHIPRTGTSELSGVGVACKPLTAIFRPNRRLGEMWRDLFDPSDWWLRLYYGGGNPPLWWLRWIRHPLQVAYWLARRAARERPDPKRTWKQ
jgi:hypothetical protein